MSQLTLTRRYTFSAAHHLVGMRERHKCSRPHGHNYVVEVTVAGALDNGLVLDAADLDVSVAPVIAKIDHKDLNEVASQATADAPAILLVQPSVENITRYLWRCLDFLRSDGTIEHKATIRLVRVRVYETERLWAEVSE